MKDVFPFNGQGNWYKGNLHCHSTMSDGRLTPSEIVSMFKNKGYSFVAFSEHELFTKWTEYNDSNFLVVPAVERAVYKKNSNKCYHIHGIQGSDDYIAGSSEKPLEHNTRLPVIQWNGAESAQVLIDELNSTGNMVMLNHPLWSYNEFEDIEGLKGLFAMEIFNYGCEVENRTGLGTVYWDSLLRRGIKVWGIATDDNHNKNPFGEAPLDWDSFGGWVCVKAEKLTQNNIANALLQGRFYSSSGPEIYDFGIRDGKAFVECSPVKSIYFLTYEGRGFSRRNKAGNKITSADFDLGENEKYVRVECVDEYGRIAWTNPIFI